MPKTKVRDNESIDDALRRFKRDLIKSGTLGEIKKRRFGYVKPSVEKRERLKENARKRRKKGNKN